MPITIHGLPELRRSLGALGRTLPRALVIHLRGSADELRRHAKRKVDHAFQEVPSYIYESNILKLPGRKAYPPGTIGTFAQIAPTIAGTDWEGQVQKYANGPHHLKNKIETSVVVEGATGTITAAVGYPEGYAESGTPGTPGDYVYWVIHGTAKMQPRPFLEIALAEYRPRFEARLLRFLALFVARHVRGTP